MGKYTLGLDIGITSIGWSAVDQEHADLIDTGVRLFNEASPASEPRLKRSAEGHYAGKSGENSSF